MQPVLDGKPDDIAELNLSNLAVICCAASVLKYLKLFTTSYTYSIKIFAFTIGINHDFGLLIHRHFCVLLHLRMNLTNFCQI